MISNVDNVVKWLEINNLEYWQVQLKDADNSNVFESDDSGFAANAKRFRDIMELSTGSRFFIKASEKKGINRGKFYEEFKNISESAPSVQGITPAQVTGVPQEQVQKLIDEGIAGFKNTLRMEALEAENKELKQDIKDLQTPINRMLTKVEPYIGTIISSVASKMFPQSAPIALAGIERIDQDENTESVQNPENIANDQQRLEIALEKWNNADPDFISLIEAVAELAATKDPMYAMAKNMLKK